MFFWWWGLRWSLDEMFGGDNGHVLECEDVKVERWRRNLVDGSLHMRALMGLFKKNPPGESLLKDLLLRLSV